MEEARCRARGLDRNTLGLRFPIWHAAISHRQFEYKLASIEAKNGSQYIRLATLSDPKSLWGGNHPKLKYLSDQIVKYLQNFHSEAFSIQVWNVFVCFLLCCSVLLYITFYILICCARIVMYNIVQWHLFDFAEDRPANIGTWRVWYFESISYQLSSNYSSSRSIPLLGDDPPRLWRSSTRKVCIMIQFWMYIVTLECCISVYISTSNV